MSQIRIYYTIMIIILVTSITGPFGFADLYSWVDENGVRHFSNTNIEKDVEQSSTSLEYVEEDPRDDAQDRSGTADSNGQRDRQISEKQRRYLEQNRDAEKADIQAKIDQYAAECKKAKDQLFELEYKGFDKFEGTCGTIWDIAPDRNADPMIDIARRNGIRSRCRKKQWDESISKLRQQIATRCKGPYTPNQLKSMNEQINRKYGLPSSPMPRKSAQTASDDECARFTNRLRIWLKKEPNRNKLHDRYIKMKAEENRHRHKTRSEMEQGFDQYFKSIEANWKEQRDFLQRAASCKCKRIGCDRN